jgi:hypothetical protein
MILCQGRVILSRSGGTGEDLMGAAVEEGGKNGKTQRARWRISHESSITQEGGDEG